MTADTLPARKHQPEVSSLPPCAHPDRWSKGSDKLGWGKIGGEDCWSPTRRANRGGGELGQRVLCCDSDKQAAGCALAVVPIHLQSGRDAAAGWVPLNPPARCPVRTLLV